MRRLLFLLFMFVIVLSGCSSQKESGKVEMTVSAAASLRNSMEEIQAIYQTEYSNIELNINYGSSGSLQKQIEQGAPVDLIITADLESMYQLRQKELVLESEQIQLLSNDLVLIATQSSLTSIRDLTEDSVKTIALGQTETVPAGKYAKESLISLGLWEHIEPKFVYAKDVRQVLTYVESGEVDAGIVYRTDALTSKKVKIIEAFPIYSHQPIIYPAGAIAASTQKKEILELMNFLQEKRAQDVFVKYGFKTSSTD